MTAALRLSQKLLILLLSVFFLSILLYRTASAQEYPNALNGVTKYDAVYEVTQGNPKSANIVFWAIRNSYQDESVEKLGANPRIAVVFHGSAVQLLSTNRAPFNDSQWLEVQKFQENLREMKRDGVNLEVCRYAVKVMGVPFSSILPEIDQVPNGFVSVIGYQMQGYAVVRIP